MKKLVHYYQLEAAEFMMKIEIPCKITVNRVLLQKMFDITRGHCKIETFDKNYSLFSFTGDKKHDIYMMNSYDDLEFIKTDTDVYVYIHKPKAKPTQEQITLIKSTKKTLIDEEGLFDREEIQNFLHEAKKNSVPMFIVPGSDSDAPKYRELYLEAKIQLDKSEREKKEYLNLLKTKMMRLQNIEDATANSGLFCIICTTNARTQVYIKCGHVAICGTCEEMDKKVGNTCIMCRKKDNKLIRLFY